MIVGIKTTNKKINDIVDTPFLGGLFIFVMIFIPAVLTSFLLQALVPAFQNNKGFTKALIFALPAWNLLFWFLRLKLYILFIPAWLLLGGIAVVKGYPIFAGEKPGKVLPSDESSVWKNLYQKTEYDEQRITLQGYIKIINWLPANHQHACHLVNEKGNFLLRFAIKEKNKNAVDIRKKDNNEMDEANSFFLDNDGNEIPLNKKVSLTFDIIYDKTKSGAYIPLTHEDSKFNPDFKNLANPCDQYYFFVTKNIRIDKIK
ncbi:MAG: hypothetical protein ABWZ79_08560 [Pedobacter agri]